MNNQIEKATLSSKAKRIKLLLTDCDGVLTDTGVYYSTEGEVLKRFSIRDGMGVERLKNICGIEVGIMTGEGSGSVKMRAEKLKIDHLLFLSVKDKVKKVNEIFSEFKLNFDELAYIGDDVNDVELLKLAGLSACPNDATRFAKEVVHYHCSENGGYGAFREFCELIIELRNY